MSRRDTLWCLGGGACAVAFFVFTQTHAPLLGISLFVLGVTLLAAGRQSHR